MKLDPSAYVADLDRIISETRESLDIIVNSTVSVLTSPDTLGKKIRPKVRKRAIFPTIASQRLRSEHDSSSLFHLRETDWEIRPIFVPSGDGIILSDRRAAMRIRILNGSHSGGLVHETLTDKAAIESLQVNFDDLWSACSPLDVLYEADRKLWLPRSAIATASTDVYNRLVSDLRNNPELIHRLDPYEFEKLTAELLRQQGISVHVTPRSKDGGFDILARQDTPLGRLMYLVECKRWSPDNPVGVEIVYALYGLVSRNNATGGMVVTTSSFTRGALEIARTLENRMTLADYADLRR